MTLSFGIADVAPFINWVYFYHAWGISMRPDEEKLRLKEEAEERIARYAGRYRTHALFRLLEANSDGDDILVFPDGVGEECPFRLPTLRQQEPHSSYLSLADFLLPTETGQRDRIGVFATSADIGLETDFDDDPYEKMMMQLIADRLAEATAEKMHLDIRTRYWGYAAEESLTIGEMLVERWQGIRPAVGYPSLPDASINFLLDRLLGLSSIGIHLTESGAMKPHASVSGLIIAHPRSHYFSVGKIGADQLSDYARRRAIPLEMARRFLAANL